MRPKFYYGSVSEGLNFFKSQGFTVDFNLEENCIVCKSEKFNANEFKITGIYRYEGDTNPDDESMVLAIESNTGLKGTLVMEYGGQPDSFIMNVLKALK